MKREIANVNEEVMADDPNQHIDETEGATADSDDEGSSEETEAESRTLAEIEEALAEADVLNDAGQLQRDMSQLNDRHLRLAAEFDNYRRRAEQELTESWGRAQADFLRRLLDAVDDLQRVSELNPETATVQAIVEGVDMVERKLLKALEEAGARAVVPLGEVFDPNTMEAMMKVPTADPEKDERVHQVFQKGYLFKGHLVRPARVSVNKHE